MLTVGTRVLTTPDSLPRSLANQPGHVVRVIPGLNYPYQVELENGEVEFYQPEELEALAPRAATKLPVGTRVRTKPDSTPTHMAGREGEIVQVQDLYAYPYNVETDNGDHAWFGAGELDVVSPEPEPEPDTVLTNLPDLSLLTPDQWEAAVKIMRGYK